MSEMSQEHKAKIGNANRGRKFSEQAIKNMSEAKKKSQKNKEHLKILHSTPKSKETIEKMRRARKGKPRDPELMRKLHESARGKRTPEQRERIRQGMIGRVISPEQRAKISATLKGRPGRKHTEETKKKISLIRKTNPKCIEQFKIAREKRILKNTCNSVERKARIPAENKKENKIENEIEKEERRRLYRENKKKQCSDPKYREELSKRVIKYYKEHPEARQKLSERVKKQMSTPEMKSLLSKLHKGDKNPMWKGGASFLPYCQKFNNSLRERVRNFFGNKCVICEKTKEENKKELSVHHVFTEKMACCESKIEEMDQVRKRLPLNVAQFGEPEFSEEEIMYIRMMVPLCASCHSKVTREEVTEKPFEDTKCRKIFTELILEKYGGKCYN